MAKIFIFLYLLSCLSPLNAYDDALLTIYSKMLPRFVFMSDQKNKIKDEIQICILYDKMDTQDALLLIEKVNFNNPEGLNGKPIKLLKAYYNTPDVCKNSQIAFFFNSDEQNIKKALSFLNKQKILSIAYDAALLQSGAEISLFIGRKVQPYINLQETTKNNIKLDSILLRVSKIYTKSDK